MNKKLAIIYFSTDALLIAACASFGAIYVLNSQVALICSTLIIFASFYAYKKQVKKRVANADISYFDEVFDDEADPAGCEAKNSENSENSNISEKSDPAGSEAKNSDPAGCEAKNSKNIKDYKKEYKKEKIPFKFYDIISAFSPLRITAYLVLILAFFMLLSRGLFEPISFLAGLAIMPIISLFASILIKE